MSLASLNRHMRGIELTPEDEGILAFLDLSDYARYELSIADRNDAAIMHARTVLAMAGCRASRDRSMPAA